MNQTIQALVWLSVLANALCFTFGAWLIIKRGGLSFLVCKVPLLRTLGIKNLSGNQAVPFNFPYYHHRKSQLKLLPIRESDIVFVGDSITDEGEWAELFDNSAIKNRGISSDTTIGVLERLPEMIASQPQTIFLMIGVNDLLNLQRSPAEVIQTYQIILMQLNERSSQTSVFVQSVLPINQTLLSTSVKNDKIRAFNEQLQCLTNEYSYPYLDLHSHFIDAHHQLDAQYTSDGIHLNGIAYRHWQALIEPHVLSSKLTANR